ncbi:unnamed protein product [marine sediment metagenome]|uniref:Outer membrane protein beta-barrel domain-containing protein n=1 Tax=marine sediment metagenome TaxID=412755 RepID=X1SY45_9ZZZZ
MQGGYHETCGPDHTYNIGGVGVSQTHKYGEFQKLNYGIRGYIGQDWNGGKVTVYGVNPYIKYDFRLIGIGGGGHLGNLIFDGDELNLFPQLDLRLGPYDIFFVEAQLADHFPGSWPATVFKLGIGTGFELKDGTSLRFGISDAGFYLNPYIPIENGLVVDPFFSYGDKSTYQIGLRLHYRLNYK